MKRAFLLLLLFLCLASICEAQTSTSITNVSTLKFRGRTAPTLSTTGQAMLYFDGTVFKASMNGGAYATFGSGGITGLTIGTTPITSGTGTRLLYETSGNKVGEISGCTSDGTTITCGSANLVATLPSLAGITLTGVVNATSGNVSIGKASIGSKFEVFNDNAQNAAFSFRTNNFVLSSAGTSLDGAFATSTVAGVSTAAFAQQVYAGGATAAGILQLNPSGGVQVFTTSNYGSRILAVGGNASFGAGDGTASPSTGGVFGSSGIGTNIAGAALLLGGGQSSGTGLGGSINMQVANKQGTGTTANNLVTVFTIAPPNTGTTAPANGFTVTSAIASGTPAISATGSDTDIGFTVNAKGAGNITLTPVTGTIVLSKKLSSYNAVATAGNGIATIVGFTSQKAETASADTNVLTVTPVSAAGTYKVSVSISVASATNGVIAWTLSWTDSNGNAQSNIQQQIFQMGTAAPNVTFTTSAAGNYYGTAIIDVNNAGAGIVVKWVGGGTTSAKMSASVQQIN